jgi:peptidyl-prolyl cis-trans isomerase SurA
MTTVLRRLLISTCLGLGTLAAVPFIAPDRLAAAHASDIRYSVNGIAITSTDIQRRTNLLKVQGVKGGAAKATEDMIDQVLKLAEGEKIGIRVGSAEIDAAYARFAKSNRLTTAQLGQALGQIGVSSRHFKDFIRTQMVWGQVLQVRNRGAAGGGTSIQDVVANMLQKGGEKPTSTEYILQQVIFVVPNGERGAKLNARKREAENLRARFQSCESTMEIAKGLIDVSVRNLGRILQPELPPDWSKQIIATQEGGTTAVRTTERGAEFIAVCRSRSVSDDKVAELQFRMDSAGDGGGEGGEELLAELRAKAKIVKR